MYFSSVLCGIGGNHSSLQSVFGKVESLSQLKGTNPCCSIEVHHIFSVLQVHICGHTHAITAIERGLFLMEKCHKDSLFILNSKLKVISASTVVCSC